MTVVEWRRYPRSFRRRFGRYYRQHVGCPPCHWCDDPLTPRNATIDHIHAIGLGGPDRLDNVVPACTTCNQIRCVDTEWLVRCTSALKRYWFALNHGAPEPIAQRYARSEQPLSHETLKRTWNYCVDGRVPAGFYPDPAAGVAVAGGS